MPSIFLLGGFFQCGSSSQWKLPRQLRNKRSSSRWSTTTATKGQSSKPSSTSAGEEKTANSTKETGIIANNSSKNKSNGTPNGMMIVTVLSGNLTDSTESMFSQSSCDSYMTAMTTMERNASVPCFQKHNNNYYAGGGGAGAANASIEVSALPPAEGFYFMPMDDDEFSDLQCTRRGDSGDWGYFVDFEG